MNKCPWKDFNGADIYEGDVISHPSGERGRVIFLSEHADVCDQWRVLYEDDPCKYPLHLGPQIGYKGMAVVVERAPAHTHPGEKMAFFRGCPACEAERDEGQPE